MTRTLLESRTYGRDSFRSPADPTSPVLRISEATIAAVARKHGPHESPVRLALRAATRESFLRVARRINIRRNDNDAACEAYRAMQVDDFTDVNARQSWANWRTIPRNLNGRLPMRPVTIVDLCCGTGDSTAVLAFYAAPGSHVLGLEMNPTFVDRARRREFIDRRRQPADVQFHVQSVLDPFCGADGLLLADGTVDVVNSSGAIGCHFHEADLTTVAEECRRVLKPDGFALVDAGRGGATHRQLIDVFTRCGFELRGHARSCLLDLGRQLCFARPG